MSTHIIEAQTHGRYLVDWPDGTARAPLLVGFHGYAEHAERMLEVLQRIRDTRRWGLASVQALNRFYNRAEETVGCWMTSQERERQIADNLSYVARVVGAIRSAHAVSDCIVYAGFSQGVAMAYRAAAFVHERADPSPAPIPPAAGLIVLAGDVPPDVAPRAASLPPVLVGRGTTDEWYTAAKADADLDVLRRAGGQPAVHVFDGGHVWDDSFVARAGAFLDRVGMARPA